MRRFIMNGSALLRMAALVCFILAAFGVSVGGYPMIPVGLAAWVGSTFV
jgi:hypothetical protein